MEKGDTELENATSVIQDFVFLCLFVLRFYGPVNLMGSCRRWSV